MNPKDKTSFLRICDNCEKTYLKKMIYEEFKERKNQYDKETDVLESQLKNKMHDIKNKQIVLDSLNADVYALLYCLLITPLLPHSPFFLERK